MLGFFKRLIDPTGPIGNWLSPSAVFKERLGLPISAPRAMYAQASQTNVDISQVSFGERSMPADAEVPISRVRAVSAFIEEHWKPIYDSSKSTDMFEVLKASQTLIGWKVTMHARKEARAKAPMTAEEFVEHVQSLQIQATDEFYNTYLDLVKGNDPVIVDGEVLRGQPTYDAKGRMTHDGVIRGGTQIRHGRKEYNEKTKDYIHWDKGYYAERKKYLAERESRPVRNVKQALDAFRGEVLPMWKPTGINLRKDRQAPV